MKYLFVFFACFKNKSQRIEEMAHTKPKRCGDLSASEVEDTYKTPVRRSITEHTGKKAFFPKRISELSPLELSDEERSPRNDAFLNDSFIELSSEKKSEKGTENNQNLNNNIDNGSTWTDERESSDVKEVEEDVSKNASRQLQFSKQSGQGGAVEQEAERPKIFSKFQSTSFIRKSNELQKLISNHDASLQSTSFLENKNADGLNASMEAMSVRRFASAPERSTTSNDTVNVSVPGATSKMNASKDISHVDDDTPYRDFQMPAAVRRLQSSHHRTLPMSANQTKKCQSDLDKEFKSQKVLFTTPSAITRPKLNLNNNLDDTLHCFKASPMANVAPGKETHATAEKYLPTVRENEPNEEINGDKIDGTSQKEEPTPAPTNETKQKVLRINGKDFIIRERIGQGGSSTVFLAEHKETKLECALKVVNLRADPSLVEGYIKEVKILAQLQDKLNVIRLYEYALVSSESLLYMVMEKGDSDLRKILSTYKTSLPLYTLMTYLHQILQSVNYIHKNDVIHSDLKPENFLMVRGRLKLIDFGISSKMAVDATSIIKYSQVGTFNYISPEALMDTSTGDSPMTKKNQPKIKISQKSDVWSLGCILYLLLYKKTPFAHIKNVYAKMQTIIDPNKKIDYPDLPRYYPSMLLEMAQLCLKHNPKERASVADLLNFPFDMVIPVSNNQ